jgi:hypothetical protein
MYRDSNPGLPTQSASRSIAGAKKENRAKRATVTQASQVVPHPSTDLEHEVVEINEKSKKPISSDSNSGPWEVTCESGV